MLGPRKRKGAVGIEQGKGVAGRLAGWPIDRLAVWPVGRLAGKRPVDATQLDWQVKRLANEVPFRRRNEGA